MGSSQRPLPHYFLCRNNCWDLDNNAIVANTLSVPEILGVGGPKKCGAVARLVCINVSVLYMIRFLVREDSLERIIK
jgi:hypothetical protein